MDAMMSLPKKSVPCPACGEETGILFAVCKECGTSPEFPEWTEVAFGNIWKDGSTQYPAKVYRKGATVRVVLTEKKDNPGMSLTNAFEAVATRVFQFLYDVSDVSPWKVEWFERHENDTDPAERVCMEFDKGRYRNPKWAPHESFAVPA